MSRQSDARGGRKQDRADQRAVPPTLPKDWAAADEEVRRYLVLAGHSDAPYVGDPPCECGGVWRYRLGGSDARPIWRCLHCGGVHRDHTRFA